MTPGWRCPPAGRSTQTPSERLAHERQSTVADTVARAVRVLRHEQMGQELASPLAQRGSRRARCRPRVWLSSWTWALPSGPRRGWSSGGRHNRGAAAGCRPHRHPDRAADPYAARLRLRGDRQRRRKQRAGRGLGGAVPTRYEGWQPPASARRWAMSGPFRWHRFATSSPCCSTYSFGGDGDGGPLTAPGPGRLPARRRCPPRPRGSTSRRCPC